MADPLLTLRPRLEAAITAAFGADYAGTDPILRRSDRGGDYQANVAMALAKRVGQPPRDVAQAIVDRADLGDLVSTVEVAGPGFINLTLTGEFLSEAVSDETSARAEHPETVVVDYSAPNVAKEMHIGHLRSTAIGDALVRVLELLGHTVVRQNHIGDWGTQFGMLIEHLLDLGWAAGGDRSIADLNALYQQAQEKFRTDAAFGERARQRVVLLQAGDAETLAIWRELVAESERHFEIVYERLGVRLTPDDICPESFFNPVLDDVAAELEAKGLARLDDGALCVFPPGFTGRDGEPLPLIVRKSDGGYGYQATDLAAARYRTTELGGTRLVYVVGAPQSQHLAMVFAVSEQAGWLDGGRRAEHVAFGSILGDDRKPYKTRSGETVKLIDVLDEAVERAAAVIAEKNPDLDAATRADVARQVGIGAVKYADLANDRVKDYVFDWDRMLSFDGNTAPYLQYAHARIRSIFRRGEVEEAGGPVVIVEPAERALALQLLSFDEVVRATAESLQPHRLATYLFELAQAFTTFYEACPVLRADTPELRASRLALCDLTARTLSRGLGLLGIEAPDRM
jgi:arginyl-tRNA synthetase